MYGSELTCVRLGPTGFPGVVVMEVLEGDPEHPARKSVKAKMAPTANPWKQRPNLLIMGSDHAMRCDSGSILIIFGIGAIRNGIHRLGI